MNSFIERLTAGPFSHTLPPLFELETRWSSYMAQSSEKAYAVIEASGTQFMVRPNMTLAVNSMQVEVGSTIKIDKVLALSDGTTLRVGTPLVAGAAVTCTVLQHKRGEKLISFKRKRRKGYKRKIGFRADLTILKIESI
jgi:large subunit ribosomal protein L21